MGDLRTLDAVLAQCRFLLGREDLLRLVPDAVDLVPPLHEVSFRDGFEPRSLPGWGVVPPERLRLVFYRMVGEGILPAVQAAKAGDAAPFPDIPSDDPALLVLTRLVQRARAHGPELNLEGVLWISLTSLVAGLLNSDEEVARNLGRDHPWEVQTHGRAYTDLLRLRGVDPVVYAEARSRLLLGMTARMEAAVDRVRSGSGEGEGNPELLRALIAHRLVFTERPDSLYHFFDLRDGVRMLRLGLDGATAQDLGRVLRSVVEELILDPTHNGSEAQWFRREFLTDAVYDKATRLKVTDVLDADAAMQRTEEEVFAAKVGWMLSLQEAPSRYLLHHLEHFPYLKAATRRFAFSRDFLKRIQAPGAGSSLSVGWSEITRAVRIWDFFNTLRGLCIEVEKTPSGFRARNREVARSTSLVDLSGDGDVYGLHRHGTVVCTALPDLVQQASRWAALWGQEGRSAREGLDADGAAITAQKILRPRRQLERFGGVAQGFSGKDFVDLFPRALDALRYAAWFATRFAEETAGEGEQPKSDNPWGARVRIGLGTRDYLLLSLPRPSGALQDGERAVGAAVEEARALAESASGLVDGGGDEDPLGILRARLVGGHLDNRGICSLERTFREIRAQVRLDGLTHWTPQGKDVRIAGVLPVFRRYGFDLIFHDEASELVFLARRLGRLRESLSSVDEEAVVWEYVALTPQQWGGLVRREMESAPRSREEQVWAPPQAGGGLEQWGVEVSASTLSSPPSPPSSSPPSLVNHGLLGPLGNDLVERIRLLRAAMAPAAPPLPPPSNEVRRGDSLLPPVHPEVPLPSSPPPLPSPPPSSPEVLTARRGYVMVWDNRGPVLIGRRVRDALFDVHRVESPGSFGEAEMEAVVLAFLRRKLAVGLDKGRLLGDRVLIPAGASVEELTPARVEKALSRMYPSPQRPWP